MDEKILDIAHVAFLDIIRAMIAQVGSSATKGTLIRTAVKAGDSVAPVDFATFDDFVGAIDRACTPIAQIEGKSVHWADGVFALPKCPFAPSIANYKSVFGALPETYPQITAEFNKAGAVTGELRVGHGSGVSPFCSIHQPMRAAAAGQVTIGDKPIVIYQLGCKSATGHKALASCWIAQGGWRRDVVESLLDENMCCYGVKVCS